jgi:(p)ppGpp synthase/HD superfamily hydrolase
MTAMSSSATFLARYRAGAARRPAELLAARAALQRALAPLGELMAIEGRIKSPISTWRKMRRCRLAFEEVHDLLALRVLVMRPDQCYAVLDAVTRTWPGQCERFKDYIASPKPNGYQSLHVCLVPHDGPRFEVQIRTLEMHRQCVIGEAAHRRYKRQGVTPPPFLPAPGRRPPPSLEDAAA